MCIQIADRTGSSVGSRKGRADKRPERSGGSSCSQTCKWPLRILLKILIKMLFIFACCAQWTWSYSSHAGERPRSESQWNTAEGDRWSRKIQIWSSLIEHYLCSNWTCFFKLLLDHSQSFLLLLFSNWKIENNSQYKSIQKDVRFKSFVIIASYGVYGIM